MRTWCYEHVMNEKTLPIVVKVEHEEMVAKVERMNELMKRTDADMWNLKACQDICLLPNTSNCRKSSTAASTWIAKQTMMQADIDVWDNILPSTEVWRLYENWQNLIVWTRGSESGQDKDDGNLQKVHGWELETMRIEPYVRRRCKTEKKRTAAIRHVMPRKWTEKKSKPDCKQ